jgi:hypothetical protein
VYVADSNNNRVQKFTAAGQYVKEWGGQGSGPGQMYGPRGIAVDAADNVYVSEVGNDRVQKFTSNGVFRMQFGSPGSGDGQFDQPRGMAVDGDGDIYVVDSDNHRIQKFGPNGNFLTKWGQYGTGEGAFNMPTQIAVHPGNGNLYVIDYKNNRVEVFSGSSGGSGSTGIADNSLPPIMSPAFPNPFRRSMRASYEVTQPGPVRVFVADVRGRTIRTLLDAYLGAGPGTVSWDGRDANGVDAAAGVYYLRVVTAERSETKKITRIP